MSAEIDAAADPLAWLQARSQSSSGGAPRWSVLQALARRTAAQPPGALRSQLAARLEARWASLPPESAPRPAVNSTPNPLRALIDQLPDPARSELRAQALHRRCFTRLRTARQLAPLQAAPAQPVGPLNTQALLPRVLAALQAASPEYVQRLLAQVAVLGALAGPSGEGGPAAEVRGVPARGASRKGSKKG